MQNGINLTHAQTPTPVPGQKWLTMEPESQKKICQELLDNHHCELDVVTTNTHGEVVVQFRRIFAVAERGTALLDAESILKQYDPALAIYLEAKDDRNALRKLRGVVVNDDRN